MNFEYSCRVCMTESRSLINIFECQNKNISKQIQYCTGVFINKQQKLPTKICPQCLKDLTIAFAFKTKCVRSDAEFKKLSLKVGIDDFDDCYEELTECWNERNKPCDENETSCKNLSQPISENETPIKPSKHPAPKNEKAKSLDLKSYMYLKLPNSIILKSAQRSLINNNSTTNYVFKIENNLPKQQLERKAPAIKNETRIIKKKTKKKEPNIRVLKCKICNIIFEDLKELKRHRRQKHMQDRIACEVCGKLLTKFSMTNHKRLHKPPQFRCEVCNYETFNKTCLKKHMNIHSDNKYTCDYCKRDFNFKNNLLNHMRRKHLNNLVKRFKCDQCCVRFASKADLERHSRGHTQIKSFFCEHCPSSFMHINNYRRHLLKQHNIKMKSLGKPGRKRENPGEFVIKAAPA